MPAPGSEPRAPRRARLSSARRSQTRLCTPKTCKKSFPSTNCLAGEMSRSPRPCAAAPARPVPRGRSPRTRARRPQPATHRGGHSAPPPRERLRGRAGRSDLRAGAQAAPRPGPPNRRSLRSAPPPAPGRAASLPGATAPRPPPISAGEAPRTHNPRARVVPLPTPREGEGVPPLHRRRGPGTSRPRPAALGCAAAHPRSAALGPT